MGKKPWRPKTQAPTSLEKAQTFVASGHVHQASMPGKPRGRQRACNRCSPLLRAEQHAPVVRRCGRRRCPGGRRSDRTRRYRRPPPPCSSETLLDNVYAVCQPERTRWRADLERGWRRTGQRELQGPAGAGRFCRSGQQASAAGVWFPTRGHKKHYSRVAAFGRRTRRSFSDE